MVDYLSVWGYVIVALLIAELGYGYISGNSVSGLSKIVVDVAAVSCCLGWVGFYPFSRTVELRVGPLLTLV